MPKLPRRKIKEEEKSLILRMMLITLFTIVNNNLESTVTRFLRM